MAWPRQICRVWGSWALCPLGGCWLIDEFQKQHGFWDPVLGRDIGQKQRDPGPRRHLSNPKTQAWRGQRRGDSGWTQRPSCLTVAPRQDGGAYGQESWLVWGCRGLGAPPSRFVTLLISGRSFATPKAPSPGCPRQGAPPPFPQVPGSGHWCPAQRPWGAPSPPTLFFRGPEWELFRGPGTGGDGPQVPAGGGRMDPALPAAASHSRCALSPPPLPSSQSQVQRRQCLICIPQVWGSSPRHFPPPEPPSPPISTLRSVLVWGAAPVLCGSALPPLPNTQLHGNLSKENLSPFNCVSQSQLQSTIHCVC